MNDLDTILADVEHEGSNPFADLETDTPAESLPAENKEEKEDDIPFHKHPRWIERENELNELRERDTQTVKEIAELRALSETKSNADIPDWFTELYGENQTAWDKYSVHEARRTEEIESRIIARQQEAQNKVIEDGVKWDQWVDTEISRLEGQGKSFDRNKLIKTMLDYSPTDANNNLDFDKGLKIYEAMEGKPEVEKSDARKQLADNVSKATTKGEPTKKDYMTAGDLRHRSWSNLF